MAKKFLSLLLAIFMLTACVFNVYAWDEASDANDENIVRFGVFSDTHQAFDGLQNAINAVYEIDPSLDGVVLAGDIIYMTDAVDGTKYDSLLPLEVGPEGAKQTIKQLIDSGKLSFAMGNHEEPLHSNEATMNECKAIFTEKTGLTPNDVVTFGGYPVISIAAADYMGNFSDETAQYLKDEVDNALKTTDGPIFVNVHFGFENTFFETGVDSFNSAKFTDAGDAIIAEIKANPRVIAFSGHTHYPVQDPRNIYQEKGGFTAIETAHISGGNPFSGYPNIDVNPEKIEENYISQCLVVEVNKTTNAVKVKRMDVRNGKYIGSPFEIDITGANQPYTNEARLAGAVSPSFPEGAAITVDDTSANSVSISFPSATLFSESDANFAMYYDVKIIDKDNNLEQSKTRVLADFHKETQAETVSVQIGGLVRGTSYEVSVQAVSAYEKASLPLAAATFRTKAVATDDVNDVEILQTITKMYTEKKAESNCYDSPHGFSSMESEEFISWDVNIETAGVYRFLPTVGCLNADVYGSIFVDGVKKAMFKAPGVYVGQEIIAADIYLSKGTHAIKIQRSLTDETGTLDSDSAGLTCLKLVLGLTDKTVDPGEMGYSVSGKINEFASINPKFQSGGECEGRNYGDFYGVASDAPVKMQFTPEFSGMYEISFNYGTAGTTAVAEIYETRDFVWHNNGDYVQTYTVKLGTLGPVTVEAQSNGWTSNVEYRSFGTFAFVKGKTYDILFKNTGDNSIFFGGFKAEYVDFDVEKHTVNVVKYASEAYSSNVGGSRYWIGVDDANGYNMQGTWARYEIEIPASAKYSISARAGSASGSNVTLTLDGTELATKKFEATGHFQTYGTALLHEDVNLSAGKHYLDVYANGDSSFHFKWLDFVSTGEYENNLQSKLLKWEDATAKEGKTEEGVWFLMDATNFIEFEFEADAGNYEVWLTNGVYSTPNTFVRTYANGVQAATHHLEVNGWYGGDLPDTEMVGVVRLVDGKNTIRFTNVQQSEFTYFTMNKVLLKPIKTPYTELYNNEYAVAEDKTDEIKPGTMMLKAMLPKNAEGKDVSVVFAIYKNGNKLYKLDCADITATRNGVAFATIDDIVLEEGATYTYKVLYLDGLDTIAPIY